MRTIEFRGICNFGALEGKMIYSESISQIRFKNEVEIKLWLDGEWFSIDSKTLGQFTGLLDKNGVKIFEGDVVKGSWGGQKDRIHSIVSADWPTENGGWVLSGSGSPRMSLSMNMIFISKLEVIGNIYTNPELLTN